MKGSGQQWQLKIIFKRNISCLSCWNSATYIVTFKNNIVQVILKFQFAKLRTDTILHLVLVIWREWYLEIKAYSTQKVAVVLLSGKNRNLVCLLSSIFVPQLVLFRTGLTQPIHILPYIAASISTESCGHLEKSE